MQKKKMENNEKRLCSKISEERYVSSSQIFFIKISVLGLAESMWIIKMFYKEKGFLNKKLFL